MTSRERADLHITRNRLKALGCTVPDLPDEELLAAIREAAKQVCADGNAISGGVGLKRIGEKLMARAADA